MLKKIYTLIASTLVPLAFVGNVSLAESSYRFSDNSSIKNDIAQLGLDYSDYKLISDKNYDKTDVIGLSESYIDDGSTKQIINYVYVYNPFSLKDDVKSFSLKYNNSIINENVLSLTKDVITNVVKYKVDFKMPTYSEYERNYSITSITYSSGVSDKIDFSCKFNQDGSNISLDYNSYIFITGKDFFDYCPFYFQGEYSFSGVRDYDDYSDDYKKKSYYSNDKKQYLSVLDDYKVPLFDEFSADCYIPDLFFLNFDTNKKIDVINEIDLSYKLVRGRDYDYNGNNIFNVDYFTCIKNIDSHSGSSKLYYETISDYTSDWVTLINKNNSFAFSNALGDRSDFGLTSTNGSIHNFEVSAKNRLSDWSNSKMFNQLSDSKLSNSSDGYTAKESFEKRQVSILVDILPIFVTSEITFHHIYKYLIEDLSVMRINYSTDMKILNARCNSGAPISSENANQTPSSSFWERLVSWFNDNFPYSLLVVGGVVIGLPLIISVVVSLVTSGGSALLSGIGKLLGKMICGFFKLIINILFLPFKLLGAILSPKKKNDGKKK